MSIQWTLVAGFLYSEMAFVLLLTLPIASPKRWQKFFKSRFLIAIENQAKWYFAILISVLALFLLDSIREIRKYSNIEFSEHTQIAAELQTNLKLFRAQRNLYISGFALFLSFVIRRLVSLICLQASLMAENEAVLKQAKSASSAAASLLNQTGAGESAQNSYNEAHQKEITKKNEEIDKLMEELEKERKDKATVVKQAKSLETEYDRLMEEHGKLQKKVEGESSKKDE
jgi:B-cell receptor-associated protein 31